MFNKENFKKYLICQTKKETSINLCGKTIFTCMCFMCKIRYMGDWKKFRKRYSSLIHNLVIIQNETKCILFPFHITGQFWNMFIQFQLNRNLSYSTAKTNCQQLSFILDWASKYGAELSNSFRNLDLNAYHLEQLSLTADEVSKIYHFDLRSVKMRSDKRENLERVRDAFVLSCNLGQRYSDMIRIDENCFSGNKFQIISQKTKTLSCVDLDEMSIDKKTVFEILDKYNYKYPYTADISNFNHNLKELMIIIGFNDMVVRKVKVQNKLIDKSDYKYNLISSHTARRTFINVNIRKHKTSIEIRQATGHRSYRGYKAYLCYDLS